MRRLENQSFLLLLVAVTLAFGWILAPFYGAILWAIVVAVIFAPLYRRLQDRMGGRPNLAAAATVLIVIAMVLLPLALIAASLLQEASGLYAKFQSGEYNFAAFTQRMFDALPAWATGLLDRFNLTDLAKVRDSVAAGLAKGGQAVAPQALSIGMNTFDFVIGLGIMLYLLFFLLRDGKALAGRIKQALPLRADQKTALFSEVRRCRPRHGEGQHPGRDRAGRAGRAGVLVSRDSRRAAVGGVDGLPVAGAGGRRRAGLGAGGDLPAGHRRACGRASA